MGSARRTTGETIQMSESRWKVGGRVAPAFSRKLLAAALGAALGITLLAPAQSAQRLNKSFRNPNAQVEDIRPPEHTVRRGAERRCRDRPPVTSRATKLKRHRSARSTPSRPACVACWRRTARPSSLHLKVGANGLRVRVAASEVESIRALPGVRSDRHASCATARTTSPACRRSARPEVWAKYKAKGKGVTDRHHRFGHRLHARQLRRPRHPGGLRGEQPEHHRAGHLPDRQGGRRL